MQRRTTSTNMKAHRSAVQPKKEQRPGRVPPGTRTLVMRVRVPEKVADWLEAHAKGDSPVKSVNMGEALAMVFAKSGVLTPKQKKAKPQ